MKYDCIIIGGGAAGLAAAVFLGQAAVRQGVRRSVLLLEKGPRVGKKLLATGNGTCNLTNIHAAGVHYHGASALAEKALKALTPQASMAFFEQIGVDCRVRPDGKVYPYSEQAGAVLDALRLEAEALGTDIRCDHKVDSLRPTRDGWQVTVDTQTLTARQVLVAVGGAAAPSLGGSADGYRLLTDLGCKKAPLFPSIVQLRTATDYVRAVKGIRVDAGVTLRLDGRPVAQAEGEVLFTEYGLSGPAVMGISRPAADWERQKKGTLTAHLDLLPEWTQEQVEARLHQRSGLAGRTLEDLFTGLLHKRVGQTVLRVAEVLPLTRPADSLSAKECRQAAMVVKNWALPVTGTQGFGGAQVTAGGIAGDEVEAATMALRRHPGLYVAGEVLDVDGDCGGFNLQFAWSSAYMAASSIAGNW
ncbi:MAG: aminoacetone oxidase family FAD-binding enzyme [Clostridia bacterium]|nr:aminoacetone oxidase family FAD-binding enzyme [Clostridia bacterium]